MVQYIGELLFTTTYFHYNRWILRKLPFSFKLANINLAFNINSLATSYYRTRGHFSEVTFVGQGAMTMNDSAPL